MARSGQQQQQQHVPAEVVHVMEQLDRHCLAPDGSLLSKSAFLDLQQAKEEMLKERGRYLEAMAVYCEAISMVEEYQQAMSASAGIGGFNSLNDINNLYPHLNLDCSPQVYESLEHHLTVSEASQRLRLPLLSKSSESEKLSSRGSFDSSTTPTNSSISPSSTTLFSTSVGSVLGSDVAGDCAVFGVADRFLGVSSGYLYRVQEEKPVMCVDMAEYQRPLVREIEGRLNKKCELLADIFASDSTDSSSIHQMSSARLPESEMDIETQTCTEGNLEGVKLIIEETEKEEAGLLDDLSSMDRKFAEHHSVLEQILSVLIKLVKDLKLQHQHQYDEMRKTWLCKRCQTMHAKLRVLEHILLRDTYTKESIPALHRIRKYLEEATEETSIQYNKAITRLREYQGVDPHFDDIAQQYQENVKKLAHLHWTIGQVEMDLQSKNSLV